MPIRQLALTANGFVDTGVLQGMPLEELVLESTQIVDLNPLVGLPLKTLALTTASEGNDFRPLLRIATLERLSTNAQIGTLIPLRAHSSLKFINYRGNGYRPVGDFWADYDAQQAAKKK